MNLWGKLTVVKSMYSWSVRRTHAIYTMQRQFFGDIDPFDWIGIPVFCGGNSIATYIPIPKVANTSIRTVLAELVFPSNGSSSNIHHDSRLQKIPLTDIFSTDQSNNFIFSVVRNPASRALSAYQNKMIDQKKSFGPARRLGILKTDSFEDFLMKINDFPSEHLDSHFKPQTLLLHNAPKNLLHTFKFEQVDQAWKQISAELLLRGVETSNQLPNLNKSSNKIRHTFSARERALIEKIYWRDFNELGYDTLICD